MCILMYRSPYRVAGIFSKKRQWEGGKGLLAGAAKFVLGIREASSSPHRPPSRPSSSSYL